MNKYKELAAKYGFSLWYDRTIRLWALTDNNKGPKSSYYFTKRLITSCTPEEFEKCHFNS
jgi:hypothetical protein